MLNHIRLENLILIDIETVSEVNSFDQLDADYKSFWERKARFFRLEETIEESYVNRAALYAEFGKIVCISVAYFMPEKSGGFGLRMKSFCGDNEQAILNSFVELVNTYYKHHKYVFAGHNIKEFDIPFLCRRMMINGINLPHKFAILANKPRNFSMLDTFQIWKFGEMRNFSSLKLLTKAMGISYPNDPIDGSDLNDLYWKDKNFEKICQHCQNDLISTAQLLLHFKGFDQLTEDYVHISGDYDQASESVLESALEDDSEKESDGISEKESDIDSEKESKENPESKSDKAEEESEKDLNEEEE